MEPSKHVAAEQLDHEFRHCFLLRPKTLNPSFLHSYSPHYTVSHDTGCHALLNKKISFAHITR
jgi:hypothetical protein